MNETSSTGVWNRTMTTGGVFVYKCMASNKIGTTESMDVSVAVNGNDIHTLYRHKCAELLPECSVEKLQPEYQ